MMENKYEQQDNKGRAIVISLFGNKVDLTAGGVEDVFDLSGTTLNGNFYIEVKTRKISSSQYDTDDLEYHKMANLRNIDKDANHFYFMLFKDNVGRLYNLKDINIMDVYLSNKDCPKSSLDDRGTTDKLIIGLPIHKAKTYKWNPPC